MGNTYNAVGVCFVQACNIRGFPLRDLNTSQGGVQQYTGCEMLFFLLLWVSLFERGCGMRDVG